MFPRAFWIALLTLPLSSLEVVAAPAPQDVSGGHFPRFNFGRFYNYLNHNGQDCNAGQVRTVTATVTVTNGATATPPPSNNSGSSGNNNNNNNNGNSNSNSNSSNNGSQNNNINDNSGGNATKTVQGGGNTTKGATKATRTTNVAAVNTSTVDGGSTTTSANGAANTGGVNNDKGDAQTSLTLDPRVIAQGFANNGQDVPTEGQVASLTSTNNFINFCLTVPDLPITDGKQITTGSCNPAPIGAIPSTENMPSSKFVSPKNFATIRADTPFTIEMAINNMETGFFVNAQANYFAAPQQLNAQGQIQGHSHVVVESLTAIDQTTPTDPKKFAFFKGLNGAAAGGTLTADVTAGLPVGFYRLASINSASNHQPAIVPVAQHGSLDDAIYFTVTADGNPLPDAIGSNVPAPDVAASSAASTATASVSVSASASSVAGSTAASTSASASAAASGSAAPSTASGGETATSAVASDSVAPSTASGGATATSAVASDSVAPSTAPGKATATSAAASAGDAKSQKNNPKDGGKN